MIYSYMTVKNEADRYLEKSLHSLKSQVDGVCVLDDRSTDGTVDVLKALKVPYRISAGPSFLDSEALFRGEAWRFMESTFQPALGDWVLTLDADEFLRTGIPLKQICAQAENEGQDALWMHIHEMWSETEIRIDQAWGTIRGLRLAAYSPNGRFKPQKLGGWSLPDYVKCAGMTTQADIVHYGYARLEDRQTKYDRYSGTSGHSSRHINSILSVPMLATVPPTL